MTWDGGPHRVKTVGKLKDAGVTWVAIVIALPLIVVNNLWITVIEVRWYALDGTCLPLFITPVFILFVLSLCNLVVRRVAPRIALSRGELLTIYIMVVMGACLASHDMIQNLFGTLGHPAQFADDSNQYQKLFWRYLPHNGNMFVWDKVALKGFYGGGVDPFVWSILRVLDRAACDLGIAGSSADLHDACDQRSDPQAVDRERETRIPARSTTDRHDRRGFRAEVLREQADVDRVWHGIPDRADQWSSRALSIDACDRGDQSVRSGSDVREPAMERDECWRQRVQDGRVPIHHRPGLLHPARSELLLLVLLYRPQALAGVRGHNGMGYRRQHGLPVLGCAVVGRVAGVEHRHRHRDSAPPQERLAAGIPP